MKTTLEITKEDGGYLIQMNGTHNGADFAENIEEVREKTLSLMAILLDNFSSEVTS